MSEMTKEQAEDYIRRIAVMAGGPDAMDSSEIDEIETGIHAASFALYGGTKSNSERDEMAKQMFIQHASMWLSTNDKCYEQLQRIYEHVDAFITYRDRQNAFVSNDARRKPFS